MNSRGCRRTEHALPRPADGSGESGPSRGSAVAKVRVYELAKEFGVESKAVMAKLQEMGEFVRSASSTIEAPVVRRLTEPFAGQGASKSNGNGAAPKAAAPAPPRRPAEKAVAPEAPAAVQPPDVTPEPVIEQRPAPVEQRPGPA